LKAVAAGTGLSMILAYDRLIKEGHDPARITVRITDRTRRMSTRRNACWENWLPPGAGPAAWKPRAVFPLARKISLPSNRSRAGKAGPGIKVVTAVGILDYLPGFSCETTERSMRLPQPEEEVQAEHLAERLSDMTADDGVLIVQHLPPSRQRPHSGTLRPKIRLPARGDLSELLATAGF